MGSEQIVHLGDRARLGLTDKELREICLYLVPRHLPGQDDQRVLVVEPFTQAGAEEIRGHVRFNP
jgi:hypothetical protein